MNEEQAPITAEFPPKKPLWKTIIREVLIFAIIAVGVVLPFRMYVAEPYLVSGSSMDPTFETGDYLVVNKIGYRMGEPQRGQVVIFEFPLPIKGEEGKNLIKRIVGLPGETVVLNGTNVTIVNTEHPEGIRLDESFITYTAPASMSVTLGADEYFVLGDNRPVSYDSRSWGILPRKYIIGTPLVRLFPFTKISIYPGNHIGQ